MKTRMEIIDLTLPEGRTLSNADVLAIARKTAEILRGRPGGTYREKLRNVTTKVLRREVENAKRSTQH